MIKVLEEIITRVRTWPHQRQEDAARVLEEMEHAGTTVYRLSDEERAKVQEGLADLDAGRIVSNDEMERFWDRHGA